MKYILGMVGWVCLPFDAFAGWLTHSACTKFWRWSSCLKVPHTDQRGEVNLGGTLMLAIAMIFIAIGFIFLPISTDASQDLLDYFFEGNTTISYTSANATITDATFTGYTSVVGITPLLILVGFLAAGVISGFMGIKVMQGSSGTVLSGGSLILLGLSIVFISIGLIVEPVALDGISTVYWGTDGAGVSSSFTGYESLLLVSPLLLHIGFLVASVFTGMFGLKKMSGV